MNSVVDQLLAHKSIRRYRPDSVPQTDLERWIQAGQAASTSSFIQACTVIQVDPGANRERIAELAGQQQFVAQAPVFLVFCADMQRHKRACEKHQSTMLSGFTEQFLTSSIDVALFAQNVVVAAESSGMGVCYVGGIRNHISDISALLNLPELMYPVFGLCIGVPDQQPEVKPRLPLSTVLKRNQYSDQGDEQAMDAYDAEVEAYYQQRSANIKTATWTSQIAAMLRKEARPHMLSFLKSKGFLKR